jgi:outer membrane protein TolC
MRALPLLLALVCAAGAAEKRDEEQERILTLAEAIELGLSRNLGLRSERIAALLARLQVDEADATWDPVLTGRVGGGETLLPSRSTLAGADVVDADEFNFALGLEKPFRLGPTLGLDWRTDRTFTNSSFSTINPAYDTAFEISLTVPLLQGRGRQAQESLLRASQAGAESARHMLLDEAAALVLRISEAYWNLRARQDGVEVFEKSLQVAREIEETERRKLRPEIGRATKLDVTKAQAETQRRLAVLIQGQAELADASDELRRLVLPFSGDASDEIVLRAAGEPSAGAEPPPLAALVERALSRRHDLRRTDAELRRLEEGVVQARDRLRLQLDLTAAVTWRGVDGQFENAAGDTVAGDTPSLSALLNLTWPFGRRVARAALRRAELELARARLDRREQVSSILIEVRSAHRRLRTAHREIVATGEEVEAARSSLDGERLRLARGSTTVLEVARLEENLTQAELRLLEARTAAAQARVTIDRVTGTLLESFGLEVEERALRLRRGRAR